MVWFANRMHKRHIIPEFLEHIQTSCITIEAIHNTVRRQKQPVVRMIFRWHKPKILPYLSRVG